MAVQLIAVLALSRCRAAEILSGAMDGDGGEQNYLRIASYRDNGEHNYSSSPSDRDRGVHNYPDVASDRKSGGDSYPDVASDTKNGGDSYPDVARQILSGGRENVKSDRGVPRDEQLCVPRAGTDVDTSG